MRLFLLLFLLPLFALAQTETDFRIEDIRIYSKLIDASNLPMLTDKGMLMSKGKKVAGTFSQCTCYDNTTDSIYKITYSNSHAAQVVQTFYYRSHQLVLARQAFCKDSHTIAANEQYYIADSLVRNQNTGDTAMLKRKLESRPPTNRAYELLSENFRLIHGNKALVNQLKR